MTETFTAFEGQRRLAAGPLAEIAIAVKRAEGRHDRPILIYADATGKAIDLDTRGSEAEIAARYAPAAAGPAPEPRGRGRPKLGVVAREVTLLPRHWEWLGEQQGGASVALRKLIDDARRREDGWAGAKRAQRRAQDAAYHFMSAMAGDLPGFESAIRALYADDRPAVETLTASWPTDIREHALKLAYVDL
ncbi:DUF2239 family protein [Dongia sp.]|uniref:DUF2239 family protein n=1 Tax=Dongia sp. TaxID=1977262 RepID=UPI0035B00E21